MTRYELLDIKAALEKALNWAHNQSDLFQIIDAKKLIEKELQESEPKGLDEAAAKVDIPYEEINNTFEHHNMVEICKKLRSAAFKAGAKWMAGQGENLKCWIARDECSGDESDLYIGRQKPRRMPGTSPGFGMWCNYGEFMALPSDMFSELTYSDDPIEVELIIIKK